MNKKFDFLFRLLIIGDSGVGKSCLLYSFVGDPEKPLSTIGFDFKIKIINIEDKLVKLQIWDTSGLERSSPNATTYYKGADGIILIYDVNNYNSFKNITYWFQDIEKNAPKNNITKVLVGNKCDNAYKAVTEEEGKKLAEHYCINFFETSSKSNLNVNEVFNFLTKKFLNFKLEKNPKKRAKRVFFSYFLIRIIKNVKKKKSYPLTKMLWA